MRSEVEEGQRSLKSTWKVLGEVVEDLNDGVLRRAYRLLSSRASQNHPSVDVVTQRDFVNVRRNEWSLLNSRTYSRRRGNLGSSEVWKKLSI